MSNKTTFKIIVLLLCVSAGLCATAMAQDLSEKASVNCLIGIETSSTGLFPFDLVVVVWDKNGDGKSDAAQVFATTPGMEEPKFIETISMDELRSVVKKFRDSGVPVFSPTRCLCVIDGDFSDL